MAASDDPYYRAALAKIHHEGFGFHADACAPGILAHLAPIRERDGLVVEVGCGSGLLTKHLTDAGHRVIATDASPAMLDIARTYAPDALEHRVVALPDDPLPEADAIVSTGHALSYIDTAGAARGGARRLRPRPPTRRRARPRPRGPVDARRPDGAATGGVGGGRLGDVHGAGERRPDPLRPVDDHVHAGGRRPLPPRARAPRQRPHRRAGRGAAAARGRGARRGGGPELRRPRPTWRG